MLLLVIHPEWDRVMHMQSHEVFKEVFKTKNPKELADALGVSLSLVYKWSEAYGDDTDSGARNPLDRVGLLMRYSQQRCIIDWLCQEAGGFFVQDNKAEMRKQFLFPATNAILQEFAELLGVIAQASEDHEISSEEAKKLRTHWQRVKSVTESFIQCCEAGQFEELSQKIEQGMDVR